MNRKIRVIGFIKDSKGELLFLKRRMGRLDGAVEWELPTGKIEYGEQPEEAMSRIMLEYLGVHVQSIKLRDVVTFVSHDYNSQLNNLFIIYDVCIQDNQKIDAKDRYSAYKFVGKNIDIRISDSTASVLSIQNTNSTLKVSHDNDNRKALNGATIFVDGASRGNPGPSGIGYVILDRNGEIVKRGGEFIGFATSRVAEYFALKEGCEQAVELGLKNVRFVSDNLMVVNQLNGIYRIKNQDIANIYSDIQKLLSKFDASIIVHAKREQNISADKEANLAIDRHFQL